ncbi:hypothetical protein GQ600_22802 [Phytophthora cactorum]|nr:hypothetical protein GQ600_22802 [Phytophthora cactorum]
MCAMAMSDRVAKDFTANGINWFCGCVGFIDGTMFPLEQKPTADSKCFFDRKYSYSIDSDVVSDGRPRIILFYGGWPGSCAHSMVYQ